MFGFNDSNDYQPAHKVEVEKGVVKIYFYCGLDETKEESISFSVEKLDWDSIEFLAGGKVRIRVRFNTSTLSESQYINLVELLKLLR